ncbi:60S ribosomal protein L24 [Colletotrichum tofieldiae]|nr:60S ribosomal protein L24 [Colletotrichum tofieldiae]
MRTYDDTFSGQRIYPGKGKLYVRGDSKIFRFQSGKSESLFLQRKNPAASPGPSCTVASTAREVAKKRTRRTVKAQRAIVGASLDVIKEKRNLRPEARSAARAAAIKESKEKKTAAAAAKKAEKAKTAAAGGKKAPIASKQGSKGAAPKVQARTR